jgi:hypothetical protein
MGGLGIFELIIILTVAVAFLGVLVLSISKLIKSRITPNKKIVWIVVFLFFHILGMIAFLIYHDFYLSPELRAN